jgi:hypothetical protein
MGIATSVGLLFAVLVAAQRWLSRGWFVYPFFGLAAAVVLASSRTIDVQPLTWAKVFTLAFSVAFITAAPSFPESRRRWAYRIAWTILALNMLEASVSDLVGARYLNGLVGLSLMLTQPRLSRFSVEPVRGQPTLLYDLSWVWIAAYTSWDFAVVWGHYPEHFTDHLAVLFAPIALAAHDRRLYFQARALTLSLYAVVIVIAVEVMGLPWLPGGAPPAPLYDVLVGLNLLLGALNLADWLGLPAVRASAVGSRRLDVAEG